MYNPETMATVGTQDTTPRTKTNIARPKHNTKQKTKKMGNTDPTKNRGEPRCS